MEPKDPNKKDNIWFGGWSYNFTMPTNSYKTPQYKKETVEETIARMDVDDEIVGVMNSYPTAEKMLNKLYGKS
jgi:hypothetical protein